MKLLDAICVAADYLGFDACDEVSVAADSRFDFLLRCANRVYRDIATQYLPLSTKEIITFIDGYCAFSNLSKRISKPICLRSNGCKIKFKATDMGVYADVDSAELEYRYVPAVKTADEQLELTTLCEESLALGICAEYALVNGLYEKCSVFRDMFYQELKKACLDLREKRIKKRRWY